MERHYTAVHTMIGIGEMQWSISPMCTLYCTVKINWQWRRQSRAPVEKVVERHCGLRPLRGRAPLGSRADTGLIRLRAHAKAQPWVSDSGIRAQPGCSMHLPILRSQPYPPHPYDAAAPGMSKTTLFRDVVVVKSTEHLKGA